MLRRDKRSFGQRSLVTRIHRRGALPLRALALAVSAGAVLACGGCGQLRYRLSNSPPDKFIPNPIQITPHNIGPATDGQVWNQTVDAVDDFFRIAKQQPVVSRGGMIVDGRLETNYQVGGSLFEPWRKDSTSGFERLQSTLQSIRRKAIVTVRPAIVAGGMPGGFSDMMDPSTANVDGYVIEVVVTKDLEDVDRAQGTTGASLAARHDGTIVRRGDRYDNSPITLGWIPLGRDTQLEQRILNQIVERLSVAKTH